MSANETERLTWGEICLRFPDEWVVVTDAEWEDEGDSEFDTAVVLGHYKQRKETSPHIKAAFLHHDEIGCYWTGALRDPIPRYIPGGDGFRSFA
jgi:hypothetical protein